MFIWQQTTVFLFKVSTFTFSQVINNSDNIIKLTSLNSLGISVNLNFVNKTAQGS